MARVDEAVTRVLRAKAKLGLNKSKLVDLDALASKFDRPEFARAALDIADRGVTLLRDDQHILPLDATKPMRALLVAVSGDNDAYPAEDLENEIRWRVDSLASVRMDTRFVRADTAKLPPADSYDVAIAAIFVRVADRKGSVGLPDDEAAVVDRLLAAGKPVIVACFGSPYLVERFTNLAMRLHGETARLARKRLFVGSLLTLLGTLGYYGTYAYVIYQTVAGVLTIGMLTFLAGAIAGASSNIQLVFSTFSTIADQALFVGDLLDFFAVKPAVSSKPGAIRVPRPVRLGFEFRNVSFAYPNGREVLSGVSFKLSPGERIALVGENGQGKTTIVKLLTRLYDPTAGQILLDGKDLRDYDLDDLWSEIGVIFQDFMRYDLTASENIAMGRIEERDNIFRIRAAAQKSLAEDVIRKLPNGYVQQLGTRFDGGTDLSGGEWQKLALARAYLYKFQLTHDPTWASPATAASERAVATDPQNPDVHVTLGELRRQTGHIPDAVAEYTQALAQDAGPIRPDASTVPTAVARPRERTTSPMMTDCPKSPPSDDITTRSPALRWASSSRSRNQLALAAPILPWSTRACRRRPPRSALSVSDELMLGERYRSFQ